MIQTICQNRKKNKIGNVRRSKHFWCVRVNTATIGTFVMLATVFNMVITETMVIIVTKVAINMTYVFM